VSGYWDGLIWGVHPAKFAAKPDVITASCSGLKVIHLAGRAYLAMAGPEVRSIFKVEGCSLVPATAIIPGGALRYFEEFRPATRDAVWAKLRNFRTDFAIWRDLNGDGQVQPGELECCPDKTTFNCRGGSYFDRDLNLWTSPAPVEGNAGDGTIREFLCQGVDRHGNPMYSPDHVRVVLRDAIPLYRIPWWHWDVTKSGVRVSHEGGGLWLDEKNGAIFVNYHVGGPDEGVDYGSITMDCKIEKFSATVQLLWRNGKKAKGYAGPGEFYRTTSIAGDAKGRLFVEDMNGQARVFDMRTGVFVADVLEDAYRGNFAGPNVDWMERANASRTFTHPQTGRDYSLSGILWGHPRTERDRRQALTQSSHRAVLRR
jgi:hypothetical protein